MTFDAYSTFCRLCVKDDPKNIDLFQNQEYPDIVDKISSTLFIDITENDVLPRVVCMACIAKILEWINFKQSCEESQHRLETLQNGLEQDVVSTTVIKLEVPAEMYDNEDHTTMAYSNSLQTDTATDEYVSKDPPGIAYPIDVVGDDEDPELVKDYVGDICSTVFEPENQYVDEADDGNEDYKENYDNDQSLNQLKDNHEIRITCNTSTPTQFSSPTRDAKILPYNNQMVVKMLQKRQCLFCYQHIQLSWNLLQHVRSRHMKVPLFHCHQCNISLGRKPIYVKHLQAHKRKNAAAKMAFKTHIPVPKMTYKPNMQIPKPVKRYKYQCTKCYEVFNTEFEFMKHVKMTHSIPESSIGNSLTCINCSASFPNRDSLRFHITKARCFLQYVCGICSVTFTNPLQHPRNCMKMVGSMKIMQKILPNPSSELNFTCITCRAPFTSFTQLTAHRSANISCNPVASIAPQCNQELQRKQYQQRFKTAQECPICHKWLSQRYILQKHMQFIHNTEIVPRSDVHRCPVCKKQFKSLAGLRGHESVHLNAPPPPQTVQSSAPRCSVCKQYFKTLAGLRGHERVHSKGAVAKRMKCAICVLTFANIGDLRKHIFVKHNPNLSKGAIFCEFCKMAFDNLQALASHITEYHKTPSTNNHQGIGIKPKLEPTE